MGRWFFALLREYDLLISEFAANRQRQGLRVRNSRYDDLITTLREFMKKNKFNRVPNSVFTLYWPAEIVVERLDFRNPGLSRRMNRLLSWFGLSFSASAALPVFMQM